MKGDTSVLLGVKGLNSFGMLIRVPEGVPGLHEDVPLFPLFLYFGDGALYVAGIPLDLVLGGPELAPPLTKLHHLVAEVVALAVEVVLDGLHLRLRCNGRYN